MNKLFRNRQNSGITLVALVVTIVILLILAGVSINLVLGENGIITQAKRAKKETNEANQRENQELSDLDARLDELVGDEAGGSGNGGSSTLPITKTTKPYMPGDTFTVVAGTTLDNGLTIQDAAENGNQYVWVEVPKTETVYPNAGLNITEFTTDDYEHIAKDLHTYTSTYRNETSYSDVPDSFDSSDGWFTPEQYAAQEQKMLKSVYQNGGFWVAKYEAGLTEENQRTVETPAPTIAPQSKANLVPYTWVTRTEAKKLAEMVTYTKGETTYTGSLMFGVQWDLVLKFIETKKIATDAKIVSKLNSDSTTIGNYKDATFTINRGKYATVSKNWKLSNTWNAYTIPTANYVGENANKLKQSSEDDCNGILLLTTGAADQHSLMNIYDIAGNVAEWTLEYTSYGNGAYSCVNRGGGCYDTGSYGLASHHSQHPTFNKDDYTGFRLSLY